MIDDPIVEEIRKFRQEHAAKYNNDLHEIVAALREQEKNSGKTYINRSATNLDGKTHLIGKKFPVQTSENRQSVNAIANAILHQMGLDPNQLSYFYKGLNQKLVGVVPVEPIKTIIG